MRLLVSGRKAFLVNKLTLAEQTLKTGDLILVQNKKAEGGEVFVKLMTGHTSILDFDKEDIVKSLKFQL